MYWSFVTVIDFQLKENNVTLTANCTKDVTQDAVYGTKSRKQYMEFTQLIYVPFGNNLLPFKTLRHRQRSFVTQTFLWWTKGSFRPQGTGHVSSHLLKKYKK
jgi:hypothetical protein